MCVCVCIYVMLCFQAEQCVCSYICIFLYACGHTHKHTYMYTYKHQHVHTYIHKSIGLMRIYSRTIYALCQIGRHISTLLYYRAAVVFICMYMYVCIYLPHYKHTVSKRMTHEHPMLSLPRTLHRYAGPGMPSTPYPLHVCACVHVYM